jgi:hypothetical protein
MLLFIGSIEEYRICGLIILTVRVISLIHEQLQKFHKYRDIAKTKRTKKARNIETSKKLQQLEKLVPFDPLQTPSK